MASKSCVQDTTRYNKCGRIGRKWPVFFFTFIKECCLVIEKNVNKKLANRISHQIRYKQCLKGKFGKGVQICEGGSISAVTPVRTSNFTSAATFETIRFDRFVWVHLPFYSTGLVEQIGKRSTSFHTLNRFMCQI